MTVDQTTISNKRLETDGHPSLNNEETVSTAKAQGLLMKLSKEVTEAALYRSQIQRMIKAKVGDMNFKTVG